MGRDLRRVQAACRTAPLAPPAPAARRVAPLIVGAVVLADQLTKAWVVANHSDAPLSIIGDDVEFRVARNSGGAFSTFTNATVVLAVLAIGLTIWLVRTLRRTRPTAGPSWRSRWCSVARSATCATGSSGRPGCCEVTSSTS